MKYTLSTADFITALYVALGSTILPGLIVYLNSGVFPNVQQLIALGLTGLGAAITYLLKNFVRDDVAHAEKLLAKAVKNGEIESVEVKK